MGLAHFVDIQPPDGAVRPGKIDVFKNAQRLRPGFGFRTYALEPLLTDDEYLTGIQLPDKLGMDQIQGTRFRRQNVTSIHFSQAERTESMRVLYPDNLPPAGQDNKGKRTLKLAHRLDNRLLQPALEAFHQQVQKHLRIHGGLENGTGGLQITFQFVRVDQIAVMRHGVRFAPVADGKRLGIDQLGTTGSGIPDMSDGAAAAQFGKQLIVEDFRNKPHGLMGLNLTVAMDCDTGTFLPPVLQCVKTKIGQGRGFRMVIDTKNAAGFAWF